MQTIEDDRPTHALHVRTRSSTCRRREQGLLRNPKIGNPKPGKLKLPIGTPVWNRTLQL